MAAQPLCHGTSLANGHTMDATDATDAMGAMDTVDTVDYSQRWAVDGEQWLEFALFV